jgi:hypothetical protein
MIGSLHPIQAIRLARRFIQPKLKKTRPLYRNRHSPLQRTEGEVKTQYRMAISCIYKGKGRTHGRRSGFSFSST